MDRRDSICRARVGLERCGRKALKPGGICAFHAGLQGAWAAASLRRPLIEELRARLAHLSLTRPASAAGAERPERAAK